jgi:hypothetical protein
MARLARTGPRDDADPHIVIVGAGGSRAACPNGDRNGRQLPVMADLVDTVGLRPLIERAGVQAGFYDFEALYSDLATSGENESVVAEIESTIRHYFEQLRIPDTVTVYDHLLLSLRPKDIVATFNWDPLLAQTFRRHEGLISLPRLAFLHGNVAVGFCAQHRTCGWHDDSCRVCKQPFAPSPLLYPVKDKDYRSQPFIRSEWARLQRGLEAAYFVTIFGYSAPVTDVAAKDALLEVWSRNGAREIAEIEIIDIRPADELVRSWDDFIVRSHYIITHTALRAYASWHPRRSCDALFAATMMNNPWKDDWLPDLSNPVELRQWVDPLWREEKRLDGSKADFSGRPCIEWNSQGPGE